MATYTSKYGVALAACRARTASRLSAYGAMTGTRQTTPLRASTSATRPTRRTFAHRSAREKPRPAVRKRRISSPSRTSTLRPSARSRSRSSPATVVLPALGSPVSQTVAPWGLAVVVMRNRPLFPRPPYDAMKARRGM
ncbi:hypothetical protein AMK33_01360 [Streptomyces sp. CB02400]|nr:hypothetical protein AMK33_01360 [Streptomyces sp. CB02400]